MEKYLYNLVEQYKSATGTKNIDINSITFISEYFDWLKQQQKIGRSYVTYLKEVSRNPLYYYDCVEFGKSQHDTLASDLDISMITPYTKGFRNLDNLILEADFKVENGMPTLVTDKDKIYIDKKTIGMYYTHNPYSSFDINSWPLLHNSGENIMVGVFGNIYDKDYKSKIEKLKKLKDMMIGDSCDYSLIDGTKYFYIINSNRDLEAKKLIRK